MVRRAGQALALHQCNAIPGFGATLRLLTLHTVVVATDLDPSSHAAIDSAHRLAKASGATLHVVHVISNDTSRGSVTPAADGAADAVRDALRIMNVPDGDASVHLVPGAPAESIRAFADRMSADVVVVGPHRQRDRAVHGNPLGGTARAIAEHAYAPCLIASQPLRLPLERVLVPTDFSDTARGALLVGLSLASGLRMGAATGRVTTLTALHVQSPDDDAGTRDTPASLEHELEMLREGAGSWAGIAVNGRTERGGDAAQTIGQCAVDQEADLVVIGTRGRGADEVARLGSVSASVTMNARVPTLLVPPAVWRAHATMRQAQSNR